MKPMISLGRGCHVFLLSFFFTSIAFCQSEPFCLTLDSDTPDGPGLYSGATNVASLPNNDVVVFNIFFWEMLRNDGTTDNELLLDEALNAVAELNIEYNDFNVFFKFKGMDTIRSTAYYVAPIYGVDGLFPEMEELGYVKDDAFNVYVPNRFTIGGAGFASRNKTKMAITASNITNKKVLIHEMGHCFSLNHTHHNWVSTVSPCEHVTRNPQDPSYNANVAGDEVVDTAAVPDFLNEWCREQGIPNNECEMPHVYVNPNTCQYEGTGVDCQGDDFIIFEPDVRNTMSYSIADCRDQFSNGQIVRMREAIVNDINGQFAMAETTVDQLYEPYSGSYYFAGPLLPEHTPLFQPGFEYRFVECDCNCPAPTDYNDISFSYNDNVILSQFPKDESNYGSITHPNHSAIQIVHNDPVLCRNRASVTIITIRHPMEGA